MQCLSVNFTTCRVIRGTNVKLIQIQGSSGMGIAKNVLKGNENVVAFGSAMKS